MPASGLVGDYGVGSTAVFSRPTSALTMCIESITSPELTLDREEISCISNVSGRKQYSVKDLADISDVTIDVVWETFHQDLGLELGIAQTLTVTLPLRVGPSGAEATPASYTGSGYISSVKYPDLSTEEIQKGQITFTFDNGAVPFAWTSAT